MKNEEAMGKLTDTLYQIIPLLRKNLTSLPCGKFESYTLLQMVLLQHIGNQPGLSTNELASRVNISKQQLTPILEAFEQEKLVYRQQSRQDRRLVEIYLDEEGSALLARSRMQYEAEMKKRFQDIPQDKLQVYGQAAELFLEMLQSW